MAESFDLLGDPIPEGFGRRGRPPHRVTDEKRKLVIQLQAFDWTMERIAAALSITPPTLRKNYFRELRAKAEARAKVDAALRQALWAQAEAGNLTAIKEYVKLLDKHDLAIAATVAPRKQPKLGKKEAALVDAKGAGADTTWGKLVN
jgi:hypothetical protein